jgi:DNA (cytosine-5)-methyltransferase 1
MDDSRDMIPEFVRAIRELTPRAFILENVKGLLRRGFRTYFSYVLLQLSYPTVVRRRKEKWTKHLQRLRRYTYAGSFLRPS